MRISRAVASMSASESRPLPRRLVKTEVSRSESVSNKEGPNVRFVRPSLLTAAYSDRAPAIRDSAATGRDA